MKKLHSVTENCHSLFEEEEPFKKLPRKIPLGRNMEIPTSMNPNIITLTRTVIKFLMFNIYICICCKRRLRKSVAYA